MLELNDDYRLEAQLTWPSKYELWLSREYHLINSVYSSDNATLYYKSPLWESDDYKYNWWLTLASDKNTLSQSTYVKFVWSFEETLDKYFSLLFRTELAKALPRLP